MRSTNLLDGLKIHSNMGLPSDMMPSMTNYYRPHRVVFPKKEDWRERESKLLGENIGWFTDGSKTDECVGAGMIRPNPNLEYSASMGELIMIFQAEMHAIDAFARLMEKERLAGRTIEFLSDSKHH